MSRTGWSSFLLAVGLMTARGEVTYLTEIKPLLTRNCVGCHGADQHKGGLRLDTAAGALAGGGMGPAIIARKADDSLLIQVVKGTHDDLPRMPYRKAPLAEAEIARLRQWIDEGAAAPASEAPGRQVHWAFVPPVRPPVPHPAIERTRADAVRNPIDAFIAARLEQEHLAPSPTADPVTLIRRLYLDLIGLPPSPEQVDAFVTDPRPDAYERQVDALLASPHYGERWGRWWLDAARYADSNGYSIDAPRSMWPWRDWVIRAFNEDMPFDEFVIEQLAGDLLPDATPGQRIATGFHRNTQINQEGGIDPEQYRVESIIDRVNTTGTVFLGLTVGCAQCHDHKFDPITQRDYYRLFAFFNTQDEPTLEVPTAAQTEARAAHRARVRELEEQLRAASESSSDQTPNDAAAEVSPARGSTQPELEAELRRLKKSAPHVDTTLVLVERKDPRPSYIFIKGDFTRHGETVTPGTPAILPPLRPAATGDNAASTSRTETPSLPRRLDLARWIVDPGNPLTARVTVNRVWQRYFSRGLVATENDFGTQGSPPTHPELLDWLATEWMAQHWSFKALHRLIVTSATYRQSSRTRSDLEAADPTNQLLGRQNRIRLDAEIIRDVALTASGKLNPTVGGPSVFPPQPDGVMNLGQVRREWKESQGAERYRRGMYTFYWRATPHPALAVFDSPDAFSTCTRRLRSNTPLQALTLLNDPAFMEFADALAARIARSDHDEEGLDLGFRLCTARFPQPSERARLAELLAGERRGHGVAAAWQTVARVLLNLDETMTRE